MSAAAMKWAPQQRVGGGAGRHVLDWLAVRVDDVTHSRWCTVEEIARSLECSVRSVYNAVTRLVRAALLRVFRRGRRGGGRAPSRYQLLVDGAATPLPLQEDWTGLYDPDVEEAKARARRVARDAKRVALSDARPDAPETKPADVAGLVEGNREGGTGGQTCNDSTVKPATSAGSNKKEVITPQRDNPPSFLPAEPAQPETPPEPDAPPVTDHTAVRVLDELVAPLGNREPAGWQRARLLPLISAALAAGWTAAGVVRQVKLAGSLSEAEHSVYRLLRWRLQPEQLGRPPLAAVPDLEPAGPPTVGRDAEPRPHPAPPPGWTAPPHDWAATAAAADRHRGTVQAAIRRGVDHARDRRIPPPRRRNAG
nr:hypothetical protein [Micromonospora sp. DSM 115978]